MPREGFGAKPKPGQRLVWLDETGTVETQQARISRPFYALAPGLWRVGFMDPEQTTRERGTLAYLGTLDDDVRGREWIACDDARTAMNRLHALHSPDDLTPTEV